MAQISSNEWKNLIATSASIWTVLQMLSPLPTCINFIKKQSVGDMIVTPYVVASTSCTLWLLYGLIIGDKAVVGVNTIGSLLQFSYTLCFYIYCVKKAQVRKQIALCFLTIGLAIIYSMYETNLDSLIPKFGLLCSCVTVVFFVSPLANLHYVIKMWNSESLPRLLIASTFIVSSQWLLYGYIIGDSYIMITNFLGALLSGSQIIVMCTIPRDSKKQMSVI